MTLLSRMSVGLQLPEDYIIGVAATASHRYARYTIPKRSGGTRIISHPSRELKALQRWLSREVIESFPVHSAAMAYRLGVGIQQNAKLHTRGRYLLRLDLTDFFPSITGGDVEKLLEKTCGDWTLTDRQHFIAFVCRFGRLTIGAPSSPGLSNAVCHELDSRVSVIALARGATYSRYADDMFFSSVAPGVLSEMPALVAEVLEHLEYPVGLTLNEAKTHHSSRKNRRQVTGLTITTDGRVTIGRARKRALRAQIHRYADLTDREKKSLAGYLAYVRGVEPDLLNALILKYGKERVDQARGVA